MAFYDNYLDDGHQLLRDSCRRFALNEIRPFADEWEEAETFPRELYRKAAEAGIIGIGFPENAGGCGGGPIEMLMSIEGLMHGTSTGVTVGLGTHGIALPAVIQSENAELIDRVARPVLAGEKIAALGITEPGTGSDVAGVRTSAKPDGDDYLINGAKMFISSGVRADFIVTLCRTGEDAHGGLTFIVIEREMPGVSVSRSLRKTGWRASDTAELAFDNVRVPKRNIVGEVGGGFFTVMRNFQTERLALAGYGYATAELALQESILYARERKAFGKPIMGFQVTRHKLAEMATKVSAAKTMTYQVAARMAAGEYCVTEVSMAKNLCAQVANEVTWEAVQIHGGMGYMRETVVERLSRDARLLPIGGGTQEIMREIIAKNMGL